MVVYIVNTTVKKDIQDEWLKWMKEVHIPNVLATGYFLKADIYSTILPAPGGDESSYSIHYSSDSYEKFMSYTVKASKKLQKEHSDLYGNQVKLERMVLELL